MDRGAENEPERAVILVRTAEAGWDLVGESLRESGQGAVIEARSLLDAVEEATRLQPSAVFLPPDVDGVSLLEAARQIQGASPGSTIYALAASMTEEIVAAMTAKLVSGWVRLQTSD